jgi:prevent-host-death family protein
MAGMDIPLTDAKARLTDLVHRAEHGEAIILTRHGRAVARLVAILAPPREADRRAVLHAARAAGRTQATPGPDAARSQDFLYDADGLPT